MTTRDHHVMSFPFTASSITVRAGLLSRALAVKECDRSMTACFESKRKEIEAQWLVSGLQADIEALQAQVEFCKQSRAHRLAFTLR